MRITTDKQTYPPMRISMLPEYVTHMRGAAPQVWDALRELGALDNDIKVSQEHLGGICWCSRQTVAKALTALIAVGYVQRIGTGRPATYRIFQRRRKEPK